MTRLLRIVLASVMALAACLAVAEAGRRVLDGYQLTTGRLVRNPNSLDLTWSEPGNHSVDALLAGIPADPDTHAAWFAERPPEVRHPVTAWVDDRRARGHDAGANYVWNSAAFNLGTELAYFNSIKSALDDVFTFHSTGNEPRPRYRFYPGIQTGFGFTNQFGWKSREITLAKPPGVIRIAMLGDSTTNTYPRLVEHWLNLWATQAQPGVRFEIIDASRPASDALDAAAIFDAELGAVDPDYAVVYGFGNPIATADALIPMPPRLVHGEPVTGTLPVSRRERWSKSARAMFDPLTPWSAAAVFWQHRIAGERGDSLVPEPPKPETHVTFPSDIDEGSPNPDTIAARRGGQLMGLDQYLQGLNAIDRLAKQRGTRVFVSTFRVLAFDGMLLQKGGSDSALYDTLNQRYWWPYTYAQIHRIVSFYNRTLHAWAVRTGNGVIPVDEQMPWRRELYLDGIHALPRGEALHAWIVLQQLIPAIRDDLRQHRLPRQSPTAAARYSEQYWTIDRIKTADAIAAGRAMNAALLSAPTDEVPGAFVLSRVSPAGASATVAPGAAPLITTSTDPYGYAASVPIEPVASKMGGRGRIDVRIRVIEGRLSVAVLNKSAQRFLASGGVSQSPEVQEIHLDVADLSDVGSLMISNDRGETRARSSGELHGIVLRKPRE